MRKALQERLDLAREFNDLRAKNGFEPKENLAARFASSSFGKAILQDLVVKERQGIDSLKRR